MRYQKLYRQAARAANFEEGAEILRRLFGTQSPKLDRPTGSPAPTALSGRRERPAGADVDVKLANVLNGVDAERPLPALWKELDALASVPVMVIRGANSDLL